MKKLVFTLICALFVISCTENNTDEQSKKSIVLDIVGEALPPLTSLEEVSKAYEAETGIKIKVHPFEFETALQKAQLDFATGSGDYDLVMGIFYNHGRYFESGFIEPFDSPLFAGLEQVPDSQFYPALREATMYYEETKVAYPFSAQTMFLWYRKDLFSDPNERSEFLKKYGYELPTPNERTPMYWSQYRDIAEFFTRKTGDKLGDTILTTNFYGNALQMKKHPASFYEFTNFVFSFGGRFFDEKGTPTINTQENIEALGYYVDLQKFAPPGYLQSTWDDALAQMQQNQVAMTIMWSDAPSELYNESASKVVNKVGFSLVPMKKGIEKKVATFGGWGFLINKNSSHKEEAFKFVQWISSNKQQQIWANNGGLPGAAAIFESDEYLQIPYMPAQNEALKNLVFWPKLPFSEQFISIGIEVLSEATSGQLTPEEAMKKLQTETDSLVSKYGK